MTGYSIGVDLGGTNLRAAAIDCTGKMLEKIAGSTNFSEGRDAVLADIVAAMSALRERHGTAELAGIGIGVPGFIQFKEGIVRNANNLPFLENFAMRDALEKQLGSRVVLENDANAAALGEKWMGAGRQDCDLVLLTLGTGIGGSTDMTFTTVNGSILIRKKKQLGHTGRLRAGFTTRTKTAFSRCWRNGRSLLPN